MSNRNSNAGTAADGSTPDEVTTLSQTIAKPDVSGSPFLPRTCTGVKCMRKGCRNLAAHKVGEQNIWCNMDGDWNDEKQKHKEFNQRHELTTYLCEEHFTELMYRETEYNTIEDNRYEGRPKLD